MKMTNLRNKWISGGLLITQLAMVPVCGANPTTDTPTAEKTFLSSVIALEGQKMTDQAFQQKLVDYTKDYVNTAPVEGRAERTQQAMVDLGIYQPAQAHNLEQGIEAAARTITSSQYSSDAELQSSIQLQLSSLLENAPAGAQFSNCKFFGYAGTAALLAGAGASFWALMKYGSSVQYNSAGEEDVSSINGTWGVVGLAALIAAGVVYDYTADGSCE